MNSMFNRLAAAPHHGSRGADAELMGGAVDAQPFFGVAFKAGDTLADFVVKNFGAGAGNGIEAGIAEPGNRVADGNVRNLGDIQDFRCGKHVEVDLEVLLNGAEKIFVPLDGKVGVKSALHQDAGAAQIERFLDLLVNDFFGVDVGFVVTFGAVEGAEAAELGADVGVIDVAVNYITSDVMRMKLSP